MTSDEKTREQIKTEACDLHRATRAPDGSGVQVDVKIEEEVTNSHVRGPAQPKHTRDEGI
jgi:hypothetical protein